MGRKHKPLELAKLEGNTGHRSLPENELQPPTELVEPPDDLDGYALEEWDRVTPGLEAMGVLYALDIQILAAYCDSYSQWKTARELLAERVENAGGNKLAGFVDKTSNGNVIQNCLVGIANKAKIDMLKFAAEFGLSPSVRARIGFDIGKNKESKWAGLLGKK